MGQYKKYSPVSKVQKDDDEWKSLFKKNSISCNIMFCSDRGSFDRKSVDQNCVFSFDQNFHNQLTKIFDAFQLIE